MPLLVFVLFIILSLSGCYNSEQPLQERAMSDSTMDARALWANCDPGEDYFPATAQPGKITYLDNYTGPSGDCELHMQNMFDKMHDENPAASQSPGFTDDDAFTASLVSYPTST